MHSCGPLRWLSWSMMEDVARCSLLLYLRLLLVQCNICFVKMLVCLQSLDVWLLKENLLSSHCLTGYIIKALVAHWCHQLRYVVPVELGDMFSVTHFWHHVTIVEHWKCCWLMSLFLRSLNTDAPGNWMAGPMYWPKVLVFDHLGIIVVRP